MAPGTGRPTPYPIRVAMSVRQDTQRLLSYSAVLAGIDIECASYPLQIVPLVGPGPDLKK